MNGVEVDMEVVEVVAVVEHEDVVGEGGRSECRPKRRRNAGIAEQPFMNSTAVCWPGNASCR